METQEEYKDLATRHNEGKLKWSLVDFKSLEPMVRVLEFGAEKYEVDNWKKGLKVTEIIDSCYRHLADLRDGLIVDNDSGLPIVGHLQSNLMFLQWMLKNRPELDDRPNDAISRLKQALDTIRIEPNYSKGGRPEKTLVTMDGRNVPNLENNT